MDSILCLYSNNHCLTFVGWLAPGIIVRVQPNLSNNFHKLKRNNPTSLGFTANPHGVDVYPWSAASLAGQSLLPIKRLLNFQIPKQRRPRWIAWDACFEMSRLGDSTVFLFPLDCLEKSCIFSILSNSLLSKFELYSYFISSHDSSFGRNSRLIKRNCRACHTRIFVTWFMLHSTLLAGSEDSGSWELTK